MRHRRAAGGNKEAQPAASLLLVVLGSLCAHVAHGTIQIPVWGAFNAPGWTAPDWMAHSLQAWEQCGGTGGHCMGEECQDAPWPDRQCMPGFQCVRDNEEWWQCEAHNDGSGPNDMRRYNRAGYRSSSSQDPNSDTGMPLPGSFRDQSSNQGTPGSFQGPGSNVGFPREGPVNGPGSSNIGQPGNMNGGGSSNTGPTGSMNGDGISNTGHQSSFMVRSSDAGFGGGAPGGGSNTGVQRRDGGFQGSNPSQQPGNDNNGPCPQLPGFSLIPDVGITGTALGQLAPGLSVFQAATRCMADCSCRSFVRTPQGLSMKSAVAPLEKLPGSCLYLRTSYDPSCNFKPGVDMSHGDRLCTTRTQPRQVAGLPQACPSSHPLKQGGKCYQACKSGYIAAGGTCYQECPQGYHDAGADCLKPATYPRGPGYPWKFTDLMPTLGGAKKRCEREHTGGCERWAAMYYPKCKEGYKPRGCCACSAVCPDNMQDKGDVCSKAKYTLAAGIHPDCKDGLEYDEQSGACYMACPRGFRGVGNACWSDVGPFPEKCGDVAFGTTSAACDKLKAAVGHLGAAGLSISKLTAADLPNAAWQTYLTALSDLTQIPPC